MKILFYFIFLISIENIISSPNCQIGVNFCEDCNPITKLCIKCVNNIYLPDENGGCKPSKKCVEKNNYCLECNDDKNLCKHCEENYYPDENGGCSYTNNCEVSYEGKCLECKEDFILLGKDEKDEISICKSLDHEDFKNCELINKENGKCEKCKNGYFLNTGDKKCVSSDNCAQSSFGTCIKCREGYYLNKKELKCYRQEGKLLNCKETLDNNTCEICYDSYYFDENGICCRSKYCSESGNYGKCIKCIDGYFLTGYEDSCTPEEKCHFGNKDLGICTKCEKNYYIDLKDGKCKSNKEDEDFQFCEIADGVCNTCIYGYYIGDDNKCSKSRHCSESEGGKCLECQNNFYFGLDNICNIKHCIYSNLEGDCIECDKKYYYNTKGKNCQISEGKFENCKIGADNCEICHKDFYLNKTDKLCYNNSEEGPFYKCSYSDAEGEKCELCLDNYYLGYLDKLCTTIEGCDKSENENKCTKCNNYYCLNLKDNKCYPNDKIEKEEDKFYFRCKQTNKKGTQCSICLDGYILSDNGLCIDEDHCEEMEDGVCKSCLNSGLYSYCLNELFGCVESLWPYCLECNIITDFNICDKCMEGYVLNEHNECEKQLKE